MTSAKSSGVPLLIVPGLGGSGPGHWQTLWQAEFPNARRVEQADWDVPVREAWIASLRADIERSPGAVVVAHSLGCIILAHLLDQCADLRVGAALLVAPADVERPSPVHDAVRQFAPVPLARMPFPSTIVASSNDPYVSPERAATFASAWGSELVDIGASGHINVDAGFGAWPHGRAILDRLIVRVAPSA